MDIDVDELQLILLPGKCPPKQYLQQYLKAYHCWREVWEETYTKELKVDAYLTSDEFTRQDEIVALFHKGECSAVCFLKWVEAGEDPVKQDSYFKVWPELAFRKLCNKGPKLIVCSQFTVHSKYRKNNNEISWKDLLMALVLKRFSHTGRDAMTGTMRLQKNMGETTYRGGAVPLMKSVEYSGPEDLVDLVAIYKGGAVPFPTPIINELVAKIFPQTIALVNPILKDDEVKNAA